MKDAKDQIDDTDRPDVIHAIPPAAKDGEAAPERDTDSVDEEDRRLAREAEDTDGWSAGLESSEQGIW